MICLSSNFRGVCQPWKRRILISYCKSFSIDFLSLQETMIASDPSHFFKSIWGAANTESFFQPSIGRSGGLMCSWNSKKFRVDSCEDGPDFILISGIWLSSIRIKVFNIYAPSTSTERRALWETLAVKKINSSFFQDGEVASLTEIVTSISKLHHPNILPLAGYCSEQGHNMLLYEYFRHGSLHEFLHLSDEFSRPLTWNTRVRIALGIAKAVEYLHETCSPPLSHKGIKSSNIMLDNELTPRLSECGLASFYEKSSENLRAGYTPPECTNGSVGTIKSDVYSFGVVMLELLTGRMPYDSSKPRSEQFLALWATPQLHDIDALERMVDPALRGLYPPKSISRFADIVALCVQSEPEFRPPISEVVQSLIRLVKRPV